MKIIEYGEKIDKPLVLVLGFFDCLHIGHIKLIEEARKIARDNSSEVCLFTFENGDFTSDGVVLTFDERVIKAERLGVGSVLKANFNEAFKNTSAEDFFNSLVGNVNVKGIVCGYDYTFGKGASGNVETLARLCRRKGAGLKVVDRQATEGEKISTTLVKNLLKTGKIGEANDYLGEPYFVRGVVVKGRAVGRRLGFPTANVVLDENKFEIKRGVYKTCVVVDGSSYDGITNFGARPTFGLSEVLTETYVGGLNEDIYGKEITIFFIEYIRDIKKFSSEEELVEQLKKDKERIR